MAADAHRVGSESIRFVPRQMCSEVFFGPVMQDNGLQGVCSCWLSRLCLGDIEPEEVNKVSEITRGRMTDKVKDQKHVADVEEAIFV